jgi:hypothetical protein
MSLIDGVPRDRVVAAASGYRNLLAATAAWAVVDDGGAIDGSNKIGVVDLKTGALQPLTQEGALGTGTNWLRGGALSPDQTQVAIGAGHSLSTLDIGTGAVHKLVTSANDRFYEPLRWTASGILVNERPYADYTTSYDLVRVDALSGKVSPVYGLAPRAVSPSGSIMAMATSTNLGDASCKCQFQNWLNTLSVGPVDRTPQVVASQKNHNLGVMDLADNGEVLYLTDAADGTGRVLAGDGGVYVNVTGQSVLQLPMTTEGQWGGVGQLLDSSTALVSMNIGGYNQTGVQMVLVHLCINAAVACTVTTTVVSQSPGAWATAIWPIVVI